MNLVRVVSPKYRELEALLREVLPRLVHAPDCAARDQKPCDCYRARAKGILEGR
jgi:hypothetical protein